MQPPENKIKGLTEADLLENITLDEENINLDDQIAALQHFGWPDIHFQQKYLSTSSIPFEQFVNNCSHDPTIYQEGLAEVNIPYITPDDVDVSATLTCDLICIVSSKIPGMGKTQLRMQTQFGSEWKDGRFQPSYGLQRAKMELFGTKLCKWRSHLLFFGTSMNLPIYILFKPPKKGENVIGISKFLLKFLQIVFNKMRKSMANDPEVQVLIPLEENFQQVSDLSKLNVITNTKFLDAFLKESQKFSQNDKYFCCFVAFRPGDKFELNGKMIQSCYQDITSICGDKSDLLQLCVDLRLEFFAKKKNGSNEPITVTFNPSKVIQLLMGTKVADMFEITKPKIDPPYFLANSNVFCNAQILHTNGKIKFYFVPCADSRNYIPDQKGKKSPLCKIVNMEAFIPPSKRSTKLINHLQWAANEISEQSVLNQMFMFLDTQKNKPGSSAIEITTPVHGEMDFLEKCRAMTSLANVLITSKKHFFGFWSSKDAMTLFKLQLNVLGQPLYAMLRREDEKTKQFKLDSDFPFANLSIQLTAASFLSNCAKIFQGTPNFFHKLANFVIPVSLDLQHNVFLPRYDLFNDGDVLKGLNLRLVPSKIWLDFKNPLKSIAYWAIQNVFYPQTEHIAAALKLYQAVHQRVVENNPRRLTSTSAITDMGEKWMEDFIQSYHGIPLDLAASAQLRTLKNKKHDLKWMKKITPNTTFGTLVCRTLTTKYPNAKKREKMCKYAFMKLEYSSYKNLFAYEFKKAQKNTNLSELFDTGLFEVSGHRKDYEPKLNLSTEFLSSTEYEFEIGRAQAEIDQLCYKLPESKIPEFRITVLENIDLPQKIMAPLPGDDIWCAAVQLFFSISELPIRIKAEGKILSRNKLISH
jgi:hypothetical protein